MGQGESACRNSWGIGARSMQELGLFVPKPTREIAYHDLYYF
jgi:hypothetical protein